MKIGTLNFHRSQNYGALLVSYSLKKHLEKLGLDVVQVDYYPEYHLKWYPNRSVSTENFLKKYISPLGNVKDYYDCLVFGSDTIWKQFGNYGFDRLYYGDGFNNCGRKITYAASSKMSDFNAVSDNLFKTYLDNFYSISVREDILRDYISQLTAKNVITVCDPTLLLTADDYEDIQSYASVNKNKYSFIYNQNYESAIFDIANTFSEKTDTEVFILNSDMCLYSQNGEKLKEDVSVNEFLSMINNAQYVFAASFHGVCFSVIFKKQFWCMMKSAIERPQNLLEKIGYSERFIAHSSQIDVSSVIDYHKVVERLTPFVQTSKEFLLKNIL